MAKIFSLSYTSYSSLLPVPLNGVNVEFEREIVPVVDARPTREPEETIDPPPAPVNGRCSSYVAPTSSPYIILRYM